MPALPRRPWSSLPLTSLLVTVFLSHSPLTAQEADDPYIWLEEVEGERALDWVMEQNERSRAELRAQPNYGALYQGTLEILTSSDRIAYPSIRGDHLYNFWTDADRPRGVYRRTSWDSYLSGDPDWETVLDVDALAEAEHTPWAFRGMSCLSPAEVLCLVRLSPGGSDAVEVREFDLRTLDFVDGGFQLPVSKNSTAWVDENTVLVSHNLDEARITTSGYSSAARLWRRGTGFEDAEVIASADREDMGIFLSSMDAEGGTWPMVGRLLTIFDTEYSFFVDGELVPVDVPSDANMTIMGEQMILQLYSDWTVGGKTFSEGSVVSAPLREYLAGSRDIATVVEPDDRSTINGIAVTRDYLLVNQLTDVQSQPYRYRLVGGRWIGEPIDVPDMGAVSIAAASPEKGRFFFTFSSFTQPTTLYLAQEDGSVREVRRLPEQFASDDLVTEQFFATSADGTRVPYFVVRHEDAPMDGTNPTLMYAYGGFQISRTPSYLGTTGKGWVESGGVYVLANIRGGGEYGPSWWKAALKENRQRAYDDFIAVGEDLVSRGITSPEHLGIQGGSNGGLLVGAAMTQRPDLFNAVVIQVPLLDMKRYHLLLAGASWIAEYGDPDIPEEWEYISRYSPYQNVHEGVDYPRPFIFTTTRDDRVHPGHARKMAAKMLGQGHETLYFENVEGGHGSGVTPEQRAEALALTLSYLHMQLGREGRPVSQ